MIALLFINDNFVSEIIIAAKMHMNPNNITPVIFLRYKIIEKITPKTDSKLKIIALLQVH
jgi:hypothetical protein